MVEIDEEFMKEFLERLEGPEGCFFTDDQKWRCGGGCNKDYSMKILRAMGADDSQIGEIITMATLHGGHCDCEILFNAVDGLLEWKKVK